METEVSFHGLDELRSAVAGFARAGVPEAARRALNRTAFDAREEWQEQMRTRLTLRNRWTEGSVRVIQARGTKPERMVATVGSLADYMALQEEGGTISKSHKHGVTIPTTIASGEGRASHRKKVVRRPNRLPNIVLANRVGQTRKQRNAIAIRQALADGRKYVFLELERRAGIFRLSGGARRTKLDMVWDITRPAVQIPATPTFQEMLDVIGPVFEQHLIEALQYEVHEMERWT